MTASGTAGSKEDPQGGGVPADIQDVLLHPLGGQHRGRAPAWPSKLTTTNSIIMRRPLGPRLS